MEVKDFFAGTHEYLLNYIEEKSRVIDLGCGSGDLMLRLQNEKNCRVQGIELDSIAVNECVNKGLFVYNGDLAEGLHDFGNKKFDYVILSNVIQTLMTPREILEEALRVGKKVVVSFPNFGSLKVRLKLLLSGKMPVTKELPYKWYNTPNIHFATVEDFKNFCDELNIEVLDEQYLIYNKGEFRKLHIMPNVRGDFAVFLLKRDLINE